jgi:hypothetical protein
LCGVSRTTVYRWRAMMRGGDERLRARTGAGRPRRLTAEQDRELVAMYRRRVARGGRWTTAEFAQAIKDRFGIRLRSGSCGADHAPPRAAPEAPVSAESGGCMISSRNSFRTVGDIYDQIIGESCKSFRTGTDISVLICRTPKQRTYGRKSPVSAESGGGVRGGILQISRNCAISSCKSFRTGTDISVLICFPSIDDGSGEGLQ